MTRQEKMESAPVESADRTAGEQVDDRLTALTAQSPVNIARVRELTNRFGLEQAETIARAMRITVSAAAELLAAIQREGREHEKN